MLSFDHYNCFVGRQWCLDLKDSGSGLQSMSRHHGETAGERERERKTERKKEGRKERKKERQRERKKERKKEKKKERKKERRKKHVAVVCFPWFLGFLDSCDHTSTHAFTIC